MLKSVALANNSTTTKRWELDFYPTPHEVTHALMRFLKLPTAYRILEPACGTGEMAEVIRTYNKEVMCSQINVLFIT
jgi:type I restriction-modification system DNA methylase subunit